MAAPLTPKASPDPLRAPFVEYVPDEALRSGSPQGSSSPEKPPQQFDPSMADRHADLWMAEYDAGSATAPWITLAYIENMSESDRSKISQYACRKFMDILTDACLRHIKTAPQASPDEAMIQGNYDPMCKCWYTQGPSQGCLLKAVAYEMTEYPWKAKVFAAVMGDLVLSAGGPTWITEDVKVIRRDQARLAPRICRHLSIDSKAEDLIQTLAWLREADAAAAAASAAASATAPADTDAVDEPSPLDLGPPAVEEIELRDSGKRANHSPPSAVPIQSAKRARVQG